MGSGGEDTDMTMKEMVQALYDKEILSLAEGIKVLKTANISGGCYNKSGSISVDVTSYEKYSNLSSSWFSYIASSKYILYSSYETCSDTTTISFSVSYSESSGILTINWSSRYSGHDTTKTFSVDIPIVVPVS